MHGEVAYPTRNGIAIPPQELWLPETNLNLERSKNFNNHHSCWTAKKFGKCVILNTIRDLETHQDYLPLDVHNFLHEEYEPPRLPTLLQAMTEIERAFDAGEQLHTKKDGKYILKEFGETILRQVIRNYNEIKSGQREWIGR